MLAVQHPDGSRDANVRYCEACQGDLSGWRQNREKDEPGMEWTPAQAAKTKPAMVANFMLNIMMIGDRRMCEE